MVMTKWATRWAETCRYRALDDELAGAEAKTLGRILAAAASGVDLIDGDRRIFRGTRPQWMGLRRSQAR
jgi:hypothetical protein